MISNSMQLGQVNLSVSCLKSTGPTWNVRAFRYLSNLFQVEIEGATIFKWLACFCQFCMCG